MIFIDHGVQFLTAILVAWSIYRSSKNGTAIGQVRHALNSRLDELVESVRKGALMTGRDQERERAEKARDT